MIQRFKETGHPVFTCASASSRGILRTLKGKGTMHFNADTSNTELLFWTLRSVNRLSIYGAVSNWCEQFGLTEEEKGQEKPQESVTKDALTCVKSQEVKLLASPPKLAFGSSLQENIHDFESLDEKIQFTSVCELALFKHRVSAGRKYKTRLDGSWFHFAENTHFLKHTHNPETLEQSLEEQLLDQWLKSKPLNSWTIWTWNCKPITQWSCMDSLCCEFQREESVRGWSPYSWCRTLTQCGITHWTSKIRRKRVVWRTGRY